jgi:hypothetical protein
MDQLVRWIEKKARKHIKWQELFGLWGIQIFSWTKDKQDFKRNFYLLFFFALISLLLNDY